MKSTGSFMLIALLILALSLAPGSSGLAQAAGALLRPGDPGRAWAAPLFATTGTAFTYQGSLQDGGSPANGAYDFQFLLFNAATAGSQVGSTVTLNDVNVVNGLFTVQLDFGGVFDGTALWLEVRVRPGSSTGSYTTLSPRQALTAAPYALSLRPGAVVKGFVAGDAVVRAQNTAISGTTYAVYGLSNSIAGTGVYGWATALSGTTYGVYGESNSIGGRGVFGTAPTYGVYGQSTGTAGRGVFGFAIAASGITYGVSGMTQSTDGRGVFGFATAASGTTYGVYGESASTDGNGVYGTAPLYAINGEATSTTGYATGVRGESVSTQGRGVYGRASATTGPAYGVLGETFSPGGRGVFGLASNTTGANYAIYGYTQSSAGWAGGFESTVGNGVYISVPAGKTGLNVASGTKNAVVPTKDGSRLLYTEESTEIWFTDYGFGQLQDGLAVITIDPLFAQTVNLKEPYHVFLQPYGEAALYVTNRTPTGFEVRLQDGDPDVTFSYRIVARRLGYEGYRLERAPWADNDPNLYPEQTVPAESRR